MNNETKFHSGFVALVGRPNVGKSTLMNALLGEKISIVSAHAQTTRNKITGVWNGENSQVVFLDTPGMHKPQSKLGEVIRQNTMDALDEVDLIVFLCAAPPFLISNFSFLIQERLSNGTKGGTPYGIALNPLIPFPHPSLSH